MFRTWTVWTNCEGSAAWRAVPYFIEARGRELPLSRRTTALMTCYRTKAVVYVGRISYGIDLYHMIVPGLFDVIPGIPTDSAFTG